ncbi:MAG: dTDP-4-dehydrorhamnose 3,5-epimerase [Candidatus Omnitrophica bacterium]|nr:dTDP-4-dehydrorhamnose 3,5-epimerase [Candidatus Omnitrophota bacterium]MDE2223110.1 dTDP-4-dehydrorhamnose 3,5-epimerase [Candidatus Omnitrophota bacterium]
MIVTEGCFQGVWEIKLAPRGDDRGFFMRTYDREILERSGIQCSWVQENHARSFKKGTLRGLHFQLPPHAEAKLVRVIKGKIYDVFVDLRKTSATFGKWGAVELSEDDPKMLLIPRGFAHGYCVLSDMTEIIYKVDSYYTPTLERGIRWDDPGLGISWPVDNPILSQKDRSLPTLKEIVPELPEIF